MINFLLLLAVIFWGLSFVATKMALQAAIVYLTGGWGILAVGAFNMAEAGLDIYSNGLDWNNGAQLAFGTAPWVKAGIAFKMMSASKMTRNKAAKQMAPMP